ncbi:hypothetical protein V5T82_07470 [Magnetovibrio sp. PR-2]|uniref:hypothetical protein n=1 Tax=Magnetovibrio sp. PR-2 TaxID=3120356 RepID=UPI002FCE5C0F
MSTVTPPTPPTPSAPPAASPTATAIKAPPAVQNMQPGQQIQATQQPDVTSQLPPKQVQVQTSMGSMTLQTALQIPKGATLTMVLQSLEPRPQFLITEINGKPVPQAQQAAQTAAQQPNFGAAQTAKAAPSLPVQDGARLTATLVRATTPPTSTAAAQTAQPQAQPAGQVTPNAAPTPTAQPASTPAAGTTAQTTPQPTGATPTPQAATPTAQPTPSAQPSGGHATPLPSGTKFQISVVRVDPPQTAPNTPAPQTSQGLSQGATVSGIVTGTTPKGQPIVQGPNATFALETTSKIDVGSRVIVRLETAPTPPAVKAAQHMSAAGMKETLVQSKSWGTLDEALKAIATIDPARYQQIQQNIPQPGPKLTNQLLFFMNALKGGDIKSLMGDTTARILDNERPGMMNRLSTDFQAMARLVDEPQQNDWRLALIPLMSDGALEQIKMYYRHRQRQGAEHNEDEGTRFVLDFDLSNMGHIQIDGLMKTDNQKLDLIIRTDQPLPAEMRADMGEIFMAAEEYTGIAGTLAFQAAPGHFVDFTPPPKTPGPGQTQGLFV